MLKEIADEIRGRDPRRATDTMKKLDLAYNNARWKRDRVVGGGYAPGNLREIAEIMIGRRTTIMEALERFGKEPRK